MTRYITEHGRVGDFQPEGTEASDGWSRADGSGSLLSSAAVAFFKA